jgi:hypothetical protein
LTAISSPATLTCSRCHCVSSITTAFQQDDTEVLCPRCAQRARWRMLWLNVMSIYVLTITILLSLYFPLTRIGWSIYLFINVAAYLFVWFLVLGLSLIVHSVLTWLLGGTVFALHLGGGPILVEIRIGMMHIAIHRYPSFSYFYAAFPQQETIRVRVLTLYLTGIIVFLILSVSLAMNFRISNLGTTLALGELFCAASVFVLIASLIPGHVDVGGAKLPNSAARILQLVKDRNAAAQLHETFFILKTTFDILSKAYPAALSSCDEGLRLYPENLILKSNLGIAWIELGRYTEALQLFEGLVSLATDNPPFAAIFANNAGWAALLLGDREKARTYTQEAFALMPWEPAIQGTWGAVLVEDGDVDTGLRHLFQAAEHHMIPHNRVINFAYAAVGLYRIGRQEEARAYLKKATALDSDTDIVRRAQQEIV